MNNKIIEIKNLSFSYQNDKEKNILDNITADFSKEHITAIVGKNASGKSTLCFNIIGLLKPSRGEVYFNGERIIYKKNYLNNIRKKIGFVMQSPDTQIFCSHVKQEIAFSLANLNLDKDEIDTKTGKALEMLEIAHLKNHPAHYLSYGEKKCVAIASVIAMDHELLILDEPTEFLDSHRKDLVLNILNDLKKKGTSIIISTNNLDLANKYSDRLVSIDKAKV